jgi:predicted alpha/beta-fold hydrolase
MLLLVAHLPNPARGTQRHAYHFSRPSTRSPAPPAHPRRRFPAAPLCAVGYSLGGLKLTKYLAEADAGLHMPSRGQPRLFEGSGLAAAAVVSSPVCMWSSAANLGRPFTLNYMYNLVVAHK